ARPDLRFGIPVWGAVRCAARGLRKLKKTSFRLPGFKGGGSVAVSLSHQWPEKNIAARKDYLMGLCDVPQSITGKTQITGERPAGRPRTRRDRGGSAEEKLVLAAIALSAQRGFSKVPLGEVVEKAECHDASAVHYHVKNRNGLLEAILQAIDKH